MDFCYDLCSCPDCIIRYIHQKWSYAIPLEIIYLTPLSKWNPFEIEYRGDAKGAGRIVEANGRNGDTLNKNKAYNGTHSRKFYMTPLEFFAGNELDTDLADTTANSVGVLNKRGAFFRLQKPAKQSVIFSFAKTRETKCNN